MQIKWLHGYWILSKGELWQQQENLANGEGKTRTHETPRLSHRQNDWNLDDQLIRKWEEVFFLRPRLISSFSWFKGQGQAPIHQEAYQEGLLPPWTNFWPFLFSPTKCKPRSRANSKTKTSIKRLHTKSLPAPTHSSTHSQTESSHQPRRGQGQRSEVKVKGNPAGPPKPQPTQQIVR